MKLKKAFTVILMFSVFLSGCQRQAITGISENKNDVSTSANTPAPETTPTPTPMPTLTPIPSPTSTPAPTTNTPAPKYIPTPSRLFADACMVLGLSVIQTVFIYSLRHYLMPPALSLPLILASRVMITSFMLSTISPEFTLFSIDGQSILALSVGWCFISLLTFLDWRHFLR